MSHFKIQCWGHCSNAAETDDLAGFVNSHDSTQFLVTKTSSLPPGVPNPIPENQPTSQDNSTVGTTGGQ
jgi:hypothetical protein